LVLQVFQEDGHTTLEPVQLLAEETDAHSGLVLFFELPYSTPRAFFRLVLEIECQDDLLLLWVSRRGRRVTHILPGGQTTVVRFALEGGVNYTQTRFCVTTTRGRRVVTVDAGMD
jgi:hypothetical protein